MKLMRWIRSVAGTGPDQAKPVREAAMKRATKEHTRGAVDLIRAARQSLSVEIVRDLEGRPRDGAAD